MELFALGVLCFALGALVGTVLAMGWHDQSVERMRRELEREVKVRLMLLSEKGHVDERSNEISTRALRRHG